MIGDFTGKTDDRLQTKVRQINQLLHHTLHMHAQSNKQAHCTLTRTNTVCIHATMSTLTSISTTLEPHGLAF